MSEIIFKIRDRGTGKFLCDGHKNMRDAYLDNRGAIFHYENEANKYLSEYKYDRLRFEHRTHYDLEIVEYRIDQIETRTIAKIPSMEISAAIGRKYKKPRFSDLVSHSKRAEFDEYTLNHVFLLNRELTAQERLELTEIGMYSPPYPYRRVIIVDNERSALLAKMTFQDFLIVDQSIDKLFQEDEKC